MRQRLSAMRRYAAAVKMGPFPDGNRPQMEAPSAGTVLVSLGTKHETQASLIGNIYLTRKCWCCLKVP
jgi:hypothetical protein